MATRVGLLGPPVIHSGDARLEPPAGKTTALLLYLAYRAQWISRVELVEFFWPGTAEGTARTNLRGLLTRLVPARPYADAVEIEPTRLRWRVPSDVSDLREAAGAGRQAEVLRLYRGELLEGFVLDGVPDFEEWLTQKRRVTRELWFDAALGVSDQLEAAQRWAQAANVLGRLRIADPYDESMLRRQLLDLTRAGHGRRALETYQRFRDRLLEEVGTEPAAATTEVAEAVAAGKPVPVSGPDAPGGEADDPTGGPIARSRLPTPATSIVGRASERSHLAELLRGGGTRLATLTGPGGIGKTRLALAVAHDLNEGSRDGPSDDPSRDFPDGVYFVPCVSVNGPNELLSAVADAVGLPLIGQGEPLHQVLEFLEDKRLLLVLDNLEQTRERLTMLDDILDRAPGVKSWRPRGNSWVRAPNTL